MHAVCHGVHAVCAHDAVSVRASGLIYLAEDVDVAELVGGKAERGECASGQQRLGDRARALRADPVAVEVEERE